MDIKQILYKILKGAIGGALAAMSGLKLASLVGVHVDVKTAVMAAGASVGGAAYHGTINVLEQYLAAR